MMMSTGWQVCLGLEFSAFSSRRPLPESWLCGMPAWGSRSGGACKVMVNVYDLSEVNEYVVPFGLGAFHSGVEINGREWTFAGGAGIHDTSPRDAPGAVFREAIDMGSFEGGSGRVHDAIEALRPDFAPEQYNIMTKNCTSSFSQPVEALGFLCSPQHLARRLSSHARTPRMTVILCCRSALSPPPHRLCAPAWCGWWRRAAGQATTFRTHSAASCSRNDHPGAPPPPTPMSVARRVELSSLSPPVAEVSRNVLLVSALSRTTCSLCV